MAILLDARPSYLTSATGATSLLLAPLGAGSVLGDIRALLEVAEILRLAVMPDFAVDEGYTQAVHATAPRAAVVTPDRFAGFLNQYELADRLLFIDARLRPAAVWSTARWLANGSNGCQVRHLVEARRATGGLQECVRYDDGLHVQSVHRLYDGVTHLELTGVWCSLVPVAAAQRLAPADLTSLSHVRARLTQCLVPSVDDPLPAAVYDLTEEDDYLRANHQALAGLCGRKAPAGFRERAAGIWVGRGVTVHPASRLYAPVILHDHAAIGVGAVVIGPAVLGAGARVGQEAIVGRSVLWPQVRVAPHRSVLHCVLVPGRNGHHVHAGARGRGSDRHGPCSDGRPADTVSPNGHSRSGRLYPFLKRTFDLLVAVSGLVAVSPLLVLVAGLIKLTSRGPVLFGHEREGRGGRPFRCWKFRTMVHHAHEQQRELYDQNLVDGPQFKLAHDHRVTPLGHWLRRTNIDELPQLLNVVLGQMSLIGPRPSPFRENQLCVPWRQARLSVRPGITGLWQVCRRDRDAGDFHQWVYYDVLYVRYRSLWLDLRIFLATLLTLAGRWSVPAHWMIPAPRRADRSSLLTDDMTAAASPPPPRRGAVPGEAPPRADRRDRPDRQGEATENETEVAAEIGPRPDEDKS
ncbi:MAG: sugar transferase [Planctomycetota bacterium]